MFNSMYSKYLQIHLHRQKNLVSTIPFHTFFQKKCYRTNFKNIQCSKCLNSESDFPMINCFSNYPSAANGKIWNQFNCNQLDLNFPSQLNFNKKYPYLISEILFWKFLQYLNRLSIQKIKVKLSLRNNFYNMNLSYRS